MSKDLLICECPYCDSNKHVKLCEDIIETENRGVQIKYKTHYFHCSNCNYDWQNGSQLDENVLAIKDAYRKKVGLLTSSEITSIRKKYGLSQADFSLMLGLGEVTITRYESKSIQDQTYDMLIRNVGEDSLFALEMLEKNKSDFSEEKYNATKAIIEKYIMLDSRNYYNKKMIESAYVQYDKPSRENGYKVLNIDTLNNIVGILAQKANGFNSKVKFIKELWYIDYMHFLRYGKSATGLVYTHMPMGALAVGHEEIVYLPALETSQDINSRGEMFYKIQSSKNFKARKITKELEEIIDVVVNKFDDFKAKEIIDYMHHEDAYLFTKENEIIPFVEEYKIREI